MVSLAVISILSMIVTAIIRAAAHMVDQKKAEDCCTNEIEVLDCDTVVSTDDSSSQVLYCTLVTSQSIYEADLLPMHSRYNILYFPDPGDVIGPDQQAILKIWRI